MIFNIQGRLVKVLDCVLSHDNHVPEGTRADNKVSATETNIAAVCWEILRL